MSGELSLKALFIFSVLLLISIIDNNAFAQGNDTISKKQLEIWPQRINIGVSAGYPTIPFINLGIKFQDKIYFNIFIEPKDGINSSAFFDIGYQKNNLLNTNLRGQIGLTLMKVPDKTETKNYGKPGINLGLIKPISNKFGVFLISHFGYPDDRIDYKKLINVNLGIDIYFRNIPFLFY